jgi:hypothetical protein
VLECDTMERAIELVTRDPSSHYFAVEVRPIMHMGGIDD